MSVTNLHNSRDEWLRSATDELRPIFAAADVELPTNIRFSIAFPSTGRRSKRVGECWDPSASDDGYANVIIRADQADPVEVLGVLTHELVHAGVGNAAGHGKLFKRAALAVGLTGKMRSTTIGDRLRDDLTRIASVVGPLPHGKLNWDGLSDKPKKQTARMLKVWCPACDYVGRFAKTHLIETGPPLCPLHGLMVWDSGEEEAGAGLLAAD